MPGTGRPGSTHRQKRELWHRWKAGQTLSEVVRLFRTGLRLS